VKDEGRRLFAPRLPEGWPYCFAGVIDCKNNDEWGGMSDEMRIQKSGVRGLRTAVPGRRREGGKASKPTRLISTRRPTLSRFGYRQFQVRE